MEDAADCRLIEGDGQADFYPGNSVAPSSHGGAFENWSYTTELCHGSYVVRHTGYENPYLNKPWTEHAGLDEVAMLRAKVAELESKLQLRDSS